MFSFLSFIVFHFTFSFGQDSQQNFPSNGKYKMLYVTDSHVDALYEAGCSDGTLSSSNYHSHIGFSREAPSLSTAIRSAVADVRSVGLDVDGVEIERQDLAETELAHW